MAVHTPPSPPPMMATVMLDFSVVMVGEEWFGETWYEQLFIRAALGGVIEGRGDLRLKITRLQAADPSHESAVWGT